MPFMTDARELVERFNAAWELGDLAEVAGCLSADVVYSPNAWDEPSRAVRGRDKVVEVFAEQMGPGPGPILGEVWAAGDRAVCEWRWATAEDGTVLRGLDIYRVHNGQIVTKDVFGKITTGPAEG